MKKENREIRKKQIRLAAYELMEQNGYKGTSMLAIAKRAKASNETLYSWYGNKQNLFRTLIEENTKEVSDTIYQSIRSNTDIETSLSRIGPALLSLVTSNKAIALNRAAAVDANETGLLGKALASAGRESILPLLKQLFTQAKSDKKIQFSNAEEAVNIYISLLLGDVQIRRVTGALDSLSKIQIKKRSDKATDLFLKLASQK